MALSPEATMQCTRCHTQVAAEARFCPNCGHRQRTAGPDGQDPHSLVGRVIDNRYQLTAFVAEGDSGHVYDAKHATLHKPVVVKILHPDLAKDDLAVERFRREATTVASLDNPHVVQVLDFGRTEDDRLYLAMEKLVGTTLRDELDRKGALGEPEVRDIINQVCEGLTDAHNGGLIHRDLRPGNIFLSKKKGKRHVTVLDFGLAKLMESERGAASTVLGMTFGNPAYMSPEQARGETLHVASDIYSLGCIAYEALCGHPPFSGLRVFDVLVKQVGEAITPLQTRAPAVSKRMNDLVMMMLEKAPASRPQSVSDVVSRVADVPPPDATGAIGTRGNALVSGELKAAPEKTIQDEPTVPVAKTETDPKFAQTLMGGPAGITTKDVARALEKKAQLKQSSQQSEAKPAPPSRAPLDAPASTVPVADKVAPVAHEPLESIASNPQTVELGKPKAAPPSANASVTPVPRPITGVEATPLPSKPQSGTASQMWFEEGEKVANPSMSTDSLFNYDPAAEKRRRRNIVIMVATVLVVFGGILLAVAVTKATNPPKEKLGEADQAAASSSAESTGAASSASSVAAADTKTKTKSASKTKSKQKKSTSDRDERPAASSVSDESASKATFYVGLGFAAMRKGDTASAAQHFAKAMEHNPRSSDAIFGAAEVALARGDHRKTVTLASRGLRIRKSAKGFTLLGEAQLAIGDKSGAITSFESALRVRSSYDRAKRGLAKARANAGGSNGADTTPPDPGPSLPVKPEPVVPSQPSGPGPAPQPSTPAPTVPERPDTTQPAQPPPEPVDPSDGISLPSEDDLLGR